MAAEVTDEDRTRLRAELGFQRWEALGHFFSDGDFYGMNEGNHRAAIAEYEKAWDLLFTPWQRQKAGADILETIVDYAVLSQDPDLASETLVTLIPRVDEIDYPPLHAALAKLSALAGATSRD